MPVNERSLQNLTDKYQFTAGNRAGGRTPGSPNRKTVIAKWLNMEIEVSDLKNNLTLCTAEDAIILAMIRKAISGDTNAAHLLLDGKHGKIKNEPEGGEYIPEVLTGLSDEQLRRMNAAKRMYMEALNGKVEYAEVIEEKEKPDNEPG